MDKLRSFSTVIDAISVCIAIFLQNIIVNTVFPMGGVPKIYLLGTIPLAIVTIQALRFLATQLISRSSWIRHLILREDFIEGTWRGLSPNDNALVTIAIYNHDIRVTGKVFDDAGKLMLTWRALSTRYDGDELRYLYSATSGSTKEPKEIYGYCVLQFARNRPHAAPRTYDGYHVDVSTSFEQLRFQGEKITDKTLLRNLQTLEGTKDVIRQFETDK